MKIIINKNKIDYLPVFPLSWGKLLQELLINYINKDHGITKITINGKEDNTILTSKKDSPINQDIKTIEIITKDAFSITQDGCSKIFKLTDHLKKEIALCVNQLRAGNIKQGSKKMVNILEATKPIINFINSVGMNFSLDFNKITYEGTTCLKDKINKFLSLMNDFMASQEKGDYIKIADFMENQLEEEINAWAKICKILLAKINPK